MFAHTHTHTNVCTHTHTHQCAFHTHTHTNSETQTHTHQCAHTHTHAMIRLYTHIHSYIHLQVLELACARESDKVFDAGGLPAVTDLLIHHSQLLHKDTMRSSMNVVTRLVPRMEPKDVNLESCVASLSSLLQHEDSHISDPAMKCFVALADKFIRRGEDPAPIAGKGLLKELTQRLASVGQSLPIAQGSSTTPDKPSGHSVTTIINLLSTICRGSPTITHVSLVIE